MQIGSRRENFFLLGRFGQDLAVEALEESTLASMNTNSLVRRRTPRFKRSLGHPISRRTQETRLNGEEHRLPENSHFELFLHTAIRTGE